MHWQNPNWLFALWVVPAVIGLFVYVHRARQQAIQRLAESVMLVRLVPTSSAVRSTIKALAVVTGIGLFIIGAARPRWGVYFDTVESRGVDLFVLLDVSKSMLAEDVTPNRLGRAKADVRDLLAKLSGDRVGLVLFAGAPVVRVPLTTDHAFFLAALEEADWRSAPRGGSLIGDAIRKAIESMEERSERDQVIVLITDGEDHDSFPAEAAKQAAEKRIKVFTVGLGDTEEGRRIPVRDSKGNVTYMQHDGQEVWSKMDEKTLKEIAMVTGGAYIPAKTRAYDLGQIYEEHLAKLARSEMEGERRKRYQERFQYFLVAGLLLMLLDMVVPRYARQAER